MYLQQWNETKCGIYQLRLVFLGIGIILYNHAVSSKIGDQSLSNF